MALIACPHCGKSISDTVDVCIHCGKSIRAEKKTQEPCKSYEKLSKDEQNDLLKQFSREYSEYVYPQGRKMAAKKMKVVKISRIVMSIFCLALILVRILVAVGAIEFNTEGDDFIITGIFLLIAIVAILVTTVIWAICRHSANKIMHRFLLFAKLYQTWLSAKEIKYKLVFTEKEKKYKKYFNNINPVLYMKEN